MMIRSYYEDMGAREACHALKEPQKAEEYEAAARKTGAQAYDMLARRPSAPLYEQKMRGNRTAHPKMHAVLPQPGGGAVFVVDNVMATGATFFEAFRAIGRGVPLVYAIDYGAFKRAGELAKACAAQGFRLSWKDGRLSLARVPK